MKIIDKLLESERYVEGSPGNTLVKVIDYYSPARET